MEDGEREKRSSQAMHSHSCYSCRIKNKRFKCITVINTSLQTVYFYIACDGLIRLNLPTQSKVTPKLLKQKQTSKPGLWEHNKHHFIPSYMLPDLIWGLSPSSSVPWQSFSLPGCRGVVHFAVPSAFHWLPAVETPTPTLPAQPMARHFQPVTQKSFVPMSQAWQKVCWEDGTTPGGRGHGRWSRGSATLTLGPLSSLTV